MKNKFIKTKNFQIIMTNTKTELDLLIETINIEDILISAYDDKNILLQYILSNMPKEVVNIIDTLSNELMTPEFTQFLEGSSVDVLYGVLKTFKIHHHPMTGSSIRLVKRKSLLINVITEQLYKCDYPSMYIDKIIKQYFTPKTDNYQWVKEYSIGDDVLVEGKKGRIKSINKKSISVSMCHYKIISHYDTDGRETSYSYVWEEPSVDNRIIYNSGVLYKRGDYKGIFDDMFLESKLTYM